MTICTVLRRRLFPTAAQADKLADLLETHRQLYNLCLDHKLATQAASGSWGYSFTPSAWLKDQRNQNLDFAALDPESASFTVKLVDWRLNAYLLGLEIGPTPERLRAETPWTYTSIIFRCKDHSMRPSDNLLHVPGAGLISAESLLSIEWSDSRFTVTRDSQGWLLTAFKRGEHRQDDAVEAEGGLANGVSAVAGGTHVGRKHASAFVPYVSVYDRPEYPNSVRAEHPLYLRRPGEAYREPQSDLIDVRSRLLPTRGQSELLDKMLEVHRRIFQRRLEQRIADYTTTGSSKSRITAMDWLEEESRRDPGLKLLDRRCAKLTVKFMDSRYAQYMRRVRDDAASPLTIADTPNSLAFMTCKCSRSVANLASSTLFVRGVGMVKGEPLPADTRALSNSTFTREAGEWFLITSQTASKAASAAEIKAKKPAAKVKAASAKLLGETTSTHRE